MTYNTHFASPERSDERQIGESSRLLKEEAAFIDALGAISGITCILDSNRQIIYANESFLSLAGFDNLDPILGKRPGEAVTCIHSDDMAGGCGTSEACAWCGAVNSIVECQLTGKKSVRETRITSDKGDRLTNWDLRVTTSPVSLRGKTFYVFSVEDISSEKRRLSLERIFFHDILNSAGNLSGLITLLKESSDPQQEQELLDLSQESSNDLIEEIMNHRQLRAAENGDLSIKSEKVVAGDALRNSVEKMQRHEVSKGKKIRYDDQAAGGSLYTDRLILQRILINMLKNAVEATGEGGTVLAECRSVNNSIIFTVNNSQVMTDEAKHQVFQRSFSTKGSGRGTGTYSIRLLTESYLKGKTGFTSTEQQGTTFWIELPAGTGE